ncbi:HAMP domain-containing histidine kinase [bacterium]|nr:MAG: HAMP domain-containing histidine kinase [bacterium]
MIEPRHRTSNTMTSNAPEIDVNALMRGLVHELRNPLSAILTASSLLQPNQVLDEESEMLIGVVQKESRRMNRILTEFSSFVKPPVPYVENFDLAELVRDALRDLTKEERFSGHIAIHDELPEKLWVRGDVVQTNQVLRHVLTNASEAMQEPGKLIVKICQSGPSSLLIEDSGSGLTHGAAERAFQPFFSTKPASTGLGLSISRGLLRAFGGNLDVENIEDPSGGEEAKPLGTRVRIELPPAIDPDIASETVS